MISEGELRRQAARLSVDPMIVDLDYSLGWFLAALFCANDLSDRVRFKGGTCLRKCYFADYRFSEDLDFTATARTSPPEMLAWADQACLWAAAAGGPDYRAAQPRLETVRDDYGAETYELRVYYRGPLRWGGDPRAIRLDVTRDEEVVFPGQNRPLIHPYSDQVDLSQAQIACYALAEVLAEKVRAVTGQRRFAISRDLYDIHRLVQSGVDISSLSSALPAKFAARGMTLEADAVEQLAARRAAFEHDWTRRVIHLVQDAYPIAFDVAWESTLDLLKQVAQRQTSDAPL